MFIAKEPLSSDPTVRRFERHLAVTMASFIAWILSHKLLCFLIAATVAFGISTIVLGVENADLRSEIDDLKSVTTAAPETTTETPDDMSKYRLPTTVKPLVYDLYLYPDLDTGLFSGRMIMICNEQ